MNPVLIYCAGGNPRLAKIAIDAGFKYGVQLPEKVYHPPLYFADQNWKDPNRDKYMAALAEHRPHMATVIDWEREEDLPEVLEWAEEAARYVEQVVIIPKVIGGIPKVPHMVGGKQVVLGYSVPTRYGGTSVPVWEFGSRLVHLLGGSPQRQMELTHYLNVVSTDSNYAQSMAVRYCQFWVPGNAGTYADNRYWPTIQEANDGVMIEGEDLIYMTFEKSCRNIMEAWKGMNDE